MQMAHNWVPFWALLWDHSLLQAYASSPGAAQIQWPVNAEVWRLNPQSWLGQCLKSSLSSRSCHRTCLALCWRCMVAQLPLAQSRFLPSLAGIVPKSAPCKLPAYKSLPQTLVFQEDCLKTAPVQKEHKAVIEENYIELIFRPLLLIV